MLRNLMLGIKVFRRHTIHRFGAAGAGDSIRRSALQMCRRCCMQSPSYVLRCLGSIDLVRSVGASGVHCRAGTHAHKRTHACTEARIRRMRACVRACVRAHTSTHTHTPKALFFRALLIVIQLKLVFLHSGPGCIREQVLPVVRIVLGVLVLLQVPGHVLGPCWTDRDDAQFLV